MAEAETPHAAGERVVIKAYAKGRLFDPRANAYVSLEHLSGLVRDGADLVVFDARTDEDVTRRVLTDIVRGR